VVATKQIAHHGGDWSPEQRWDQAAALTMPVFASQDAREGARAFAEKRPPVWQGR
jgi:enoyl-CoA hydratase